MEKRADQLQLPVAAVRQPGEWLLADLRRHEPDIRAGRGRRRPRDRGGGDGEQRSRRGRELSAAAAVVVPPAPTNKAAPSISGTAQHGQTLTEAHGEWTNNPTSFAYQWLQCDGSGSNCTAISGATGQSYVPLAGDV